MCDCGGDSFTHRVQTEWQLPLSGVHSIIMKNVAQPEAEFMKVQFRSGFLGIISRVLRLDVSVYNIYLTSQFQTTCSKSVNRGDCE
jgi:hypothetical protein